MPLVSDPKDWMWLHTHVGLEAVQRFNALHPSPVSMYQGHSDFYIVAQKDLATFLQYGRMIRQSNSFLKISVPSLSPCFIRPNKVPFIGFLNTCNAAYDSTTG